MTQVEILLTILMNPAFIISSLLILFAPWRWLLRILATATIAIFLAILLQPPLRDPGPGFMLGMIYLAVNAAGLLIVLTLRGISQLVRHLRNSPANPITPPPLIDLIIATALGTAFGIGLFKTLSRVFQGAGNGYTIHAILTLAAAAFAALALWKLRGNLRPLLAALSVTLAVLSLWGVTVFPASVRQSAETLAGENPFCVTLQTRNRTVTSMQDLTLLTMDKDTSSFQHHAIMLIDTPEGRVGFHWSYYQRAFIPGLRNPALDQVRPCTPRADFFATFPGTP